MQKFYILRQGYFKISYKNNKNYEIKKSDAFLYLLKQQYFFILLYFILLLILYCNIR
jgi:hypothetical protein